ncbi:hypothetical protein RCL1_000129 [Eukaryota sp. TZLM3-RCL]
MMASPNQRSEYIKSGILGLTTPTSGPPDSVTLLSVFVSPTAFHYGEEKILTSFLASCHHSSSFLFITFNNTCIRFHVPEGESEAESWVESVKCSMSCGSSLVSSVLINSSASLQSPNKWGLNVHVGKREKEFGISHKPWEPLELRSPPIETLQ